MPIAIAPIEVEMTVVRIATDPKDASHLAALGIVKGSKITLLSASMGAAVVLVRGSRLALDHKTAAKIFVA